MLWDWLWGILGVRVVSSKREVYTARLSFIWVVKEMGGGGEGAEFLTTCVIFRPLQIMKRASLERLRPVVYLSSAFYTLSKPTPAFSVKATYTPPLAYLKLRKL